ncbi:MAG: DUF2852 domain-containing protein [Rhizobiales bacterium]|nr:DUF2852 domain-containing protein [Hyphomicrobiales bacterium]
MRWRGHELAAMILGFIVFWPIGLAVIAWKIWQRRSGYPGDLKTFAQERVDDMRHKFGCAQRDAGWGSAKAWGLREAGAWAGGGATGNRAFDDWKSAELARLEEERRKLEEAQREFGEYLAHLRAARDREEFDRFRNERDAARARGEAGWRPFDPSKDNGGVA